MTPDRETPDSEIRVTLHERLRAMPGLADRRIEVVVDRGIVTLTGRVGSHAEREEAELIAGRHPGVITVTNLLEVPPPARMIPTTIEPYAGGMVILGLVGIAALIRAGHAGDPSRQWRGVIVAGLCLAAIVWLCKRVCDIMEQKVWARWYSAVLRNQHAPPGSTGDSAGSGS